MEILNNKINYLPVSCREIDCILIYGDLKEKLKIMLKNNIKSISLNKFIKCEFTKNFIKIIINNQFVKISDDKCYTHDHDINIKKELINRSFIVMCILSLYLIHIGIDSVYDKTPILEKIKSNDVEKFLFSRISINSINFINNGY